MEFAVHGNLKNYLRSLRTFLDPIPSTNHLSSESHRLLGEYLSKREQDEHLCLCKVTSHDCPYRNNSLRDSSSSLSLYANLLHHDGKQHYNQCDSHVTDHVTAETDHVTEASDVTLHHKLSCDYSMLLLGDKDIFNFALQVSLGMEHLQKLKVFDYKKPLYYISLVYS